MLVDLVGNTELLLQKGDLPNDVTRRRICVRCSGVLRLAHPPLSSLVLVPCPIRSKHVKNRPHVSSGREIGILILLEWSSSGPGGRIRCPGPPWGREPPCMVA